MPLPLFPAPPLTSMPLTVPQSPQSHFARSIPIGSAMRRLKRFSTGSPAIRVRTFANWFIAESQY